MAVVAGFLSFIVGSSIIALFGFSHSYFSPPVSPISGQVTGITPMYWVGAAIIVIGIVTFVGGIILFFLKKHH
jgi:MFS superfamily sulfate permease-like transporter